MNLSITLIACVIISIVNTEGDIASTQRSFDYIQSMGYDYFLQKSKNEITQNCAVNEMAAYGIVADATSLSEPNDICPQMQGNCCGQEAQASIKRYWIDDDRHQSQFHTAFLRMNKYILGNIKNYESIANTIIDQSNKIKLLGQDQPQNQQGGKSNSQEDNSIPYNFEYNPMCEKAAREFIQLDFRNRAKAMGFYEKLTRRAEFMQNARRGFYCMLCNSNARDYISTNRFLLPSWLWYSKDFCGMIFGNAFTTVYQMYKSYNPFLRHLMKMLLCIKPKGSSSNGQNNNSGGQQPAKPQAGVSVNLNPLSMSVDLKIGNPLNSLTSEARSLVENPLHIDSRFGLELCYNADPTSAFFSLRCMSFCEHFNIAKANNMMDGDIERTKQVYDQLTQYEFAYITITNNIFDDDVLAMKKNIYEVVQALNHNYFFYRSLSEKINLGKYSIEFSIIFKGVNPMLIAKDTSLEFQYKKQSLLKAIFSLILLVIWFK